jgi:hypothetical protein
VSFVLNESVKSGGTKIESSVRPKKNCRYQEVTHGEATNADIFLLHALRAYFIKIGVHQVKTNTQSFLSFQMCHMVGIISDLAPLAMFSHARPVVILNQLFNSSSG